MTSNAETANDAISTARRYSPRLPQISDVSNTPDAAASNIIRFRCLGGMIVPMHTGVEIAGNRSINRFKGKSPAEAGLLSHPNLLRQIRFDFYRTIHLTVKPAASLCRPRYRPPDLEPLRAPSLAAARSLGWAYIDGDRLPSKASNRQTSLE